MLCNRLVQQSALGVVGARYLKQKVSKRGVHSTSGVVATVFGATGFTGKYVVELLANIGAQIIVPFRGEETSYNPIKPLGELGQIIPVRVDVRDAEAVKRVTSRSNVVINLVGRQWETRNFKYEDVHVTAAKNIAEAAKHADRFIHVSAANVSTNSDNRWAKTKAEGEEAVRSITPWATILKPTPIYGDDDRILNKWGIISQYWPFIPLVNKDAKVQPLDGVDMGRAVISALGDASSIGQTYTLGGNEVMTWETFIKRIVAGAKRDKPYVNVPLKYAVSAARILQHTAVEPLFVPEEVAWHAQDLVVDAKEANTLAALNVKAVAVETALARVSRAYRHPFHQSELVDEAPPVHRY